MGIYLDSASADDARQAAQLVLVRGATTNPVLVARSGIPAAEAVTVLCDLLPGMVFHQVVARDSAGREREARAMLSLRPGRIGLKITCTLEHLPLARRLAAEGHVVGITAIFSAAQVVLACEAGAKYVLPYVNRTTRLLGAGFGPGLVREMREVIDALRSPVEIVAASIKTPEEAVAALLAGAHHLTLPLDVLVRMTVHQLSEQAIADFDRTV
jgi:transaldolase